MNKLATIQVSRVLDRCQVLGPGVRAVVWVQGCPLRCPGCVAPETLSFDGGTTWQVTELARWLASRDGIEGVTLSGGDPFAQADALALLLDEVRAIRPEFSAMAYSGFTMRQLQRGTAGQRALLARLDLLVDGPYQRVRHGDLRWRGSANQRLILLTGRYREILGEPDIGQGIEFTLGIDGTLSWAGVPAIPGFRERVEAGLASTGYALQARGAADQMEGM